MKVAIIVQARMASTRLPGKVLKEVLGKPLLEYQIERLRRVECADDLIIATTNRSVDDQLVNFCQSLGVDWVRGDEEDVLARYYRVCEQYRPDAIVRLTADCPLIDPKVIDKVINVYLESVTECDYASNTLQRTYPRGMDCEILSIGVLNEAYREAQEQSEREHVTRFIYKRPQRYRLQNVAYHTDQSAHRWTVDTPEDFGLIRKMLEALYPNKPRFSLEDCLELIAVHPEWSEINRHIEQKT